MKTVAVIGAGSSGLTAIKACKEEGIDVTCFEKCSEIGGLWNYHDDDTHGLPSVMKSTVINTHKEMSAFSDFPPPEDFPNYMHNTQMLRYFQMYADHFDLCKHIRFNHEVVSVQKADDYEATGRWKLKALNLKEQKTTDEIFDGIMVCSGHHVYPNEPYFAEQELFQGKIMHSHSLKNATGLENLNVLVVGIGNSAMDASVDISNVAKQVYLSTRRGAWVTSRLGPRGLPFDALFNCRLLNLFNSIIGWRFGSWLMENLFLDERFDHELYGLKPKHRFLSQHPTINDYLPNKILSGRIIVKRNIKKFAKEGVIFDGESNVTPIDVVILATGYRITFPFINELNLKPKDNKIAVYKLTFPPSMKHPSFAFIGMIQPTGSIFPIAEVQSRWFTLAINEKVKLPDPKTIEKEICQRRKAMEERFVNSPRHTIQVDYLPFMDEIASEFGAKPNMFKLAICDPALFWVCLVNPCLPYQYRLQGPHSWSKAREVIMKFPMRVIKPLSGDISCNNFRYWKSHTRLMILLPILTFWIIPLLYIIYTLI